MIRKNVFLESGVASDKEEAQYLASLAEKIDITPEQFSQVLLKGYLISVDTIGLSAARVRKIGTVLNTELDYNERFKIAVVATAEEYVKLCASKS